MKFDKIDDLNEMRSNVINIGYIGNKNFEIKMKNQMSAEGEIVIQACDKQR